MTARARLPLLLVLGTIAFATLTLLSCMVGDLATTGEPRWACPSVTPKPYGEVGPIKRTFACHCSTDPVTGASHCDSCREYYVEYEQEYGLGPDGAPPAPRPTVYGMTGTSYVFGQRVEAPPLHLIVNARSGPRVTRTGVPSDTQVYFVDLTWTNTSGAPISIDYSDRLRLRAITTPSGAVRADLTWGTNALAREVTSAAPPPQVIPPGESKVSVPIVAPAGRPKTVALSFLAQPAGSGGDWRIVGSPSLTAQQIDAILAQNSSPAAGTGALWVELGLRYGIDPVFALAFYKKESSMGRDPVHQLPGGGNSHNIGNIICTPGWASGCVCTTTHCFRRYPS